MSTLVVGSVAFDSIETPYAKMERVLGGSAAYFSISACYFTHVRLVAAVGTDFPKKHITLFKRHGIDTSGLQIKSGKTFHWEGRYPHDMNTAETVATHLNVFRNFRPEIPEKWKNTKHVFLANIDPDLQQNVLLQVRSPRFTACDTMNFWIKNKRKSLSRLLKKIHLFLANDSEAREFSNETNLIKAARYILSAGPKMVIIKKGEHGSVLLSRNTFFCAPAFPLETIYDPTGAGDTFAGGLMGYLNRCNRIDEKKVKRAMIYGSVMASYNVEKASLKGIVGLTKGLIEKRYRLFKKFADF